MAVLAEDETLPVDPGVEVVARQVGEQLEAHLGVLRKVDLGVHQRFRETMVGAAIEIAEDEGELSQLSLCAQEGKDVCTVLILSAFPACDVMVGETRIFVGAVEDSGVEAGLKKDGIQGLPGEPRLHPEAWQRVARGLIAAILIVLEERKGVDVHAERARLVVAEAVVGGRQASSQVLRTQGQGTGEEEHEIEFTHNHLLFAMQR